MSWFRLPMVLVLVLGALSLSALAQTSSVTGSVADQQGGAVINAQVSLAATGQAARITRSVADGTFTFNQVRPGQYTIQVEAAGFTAWTQSVMVSSTPIPVSVTLQVASVIQDINVVESGAATLATA